MVFSSAAHTGRVRLRQHQGRDVSGPLVGTWRLVQTPSGETPGDGERITFKANGAYHVTPGRMDPGLGKDFIATMQAIGSVPGHYSRGTTSLVLTQDTAAIRKATAGLPKVGPDTLTGDKVDMVGTYSLGGDVLEIAFEKGKTSKYVRVR